jgi:hypothetical protein
MPTLSRMKYFFRNILASHRNDRDLDDEVRSYADLLAQEKIHQGMADDEARRTARLELGGIEQVKEQVREVRAGAWFDSLSRICATVPACSARIPASPPSPSSPSLSE